MGTNRPVALLALVVLVTLSGCAIGGNTGGGDAAAPAAGGGGADLGADGGGGDVQRSEAAQRKADGGGEPTGNGVSAVDGGELPQNRAIVRTGDVSLEIQEFDAGRAAVVQATRTHGGYVAGSDESVHRRGNQTWRSGTVTLRVPSENFTAVFGAVKGIGEVQRATSDTTDVTDQLVDLEARLSNLRAQRDRLRTLYNRTNETSEVLEVAQRLSAVQSQIERLEARQRTLRQRVAYSTITVRLVEPEPEPETEPAPKFHETGLVAAFLESVDGVVVTIRSLAVALAYLLPYLVVFGVPLAVAAGYLHRRE